MIVIDRADRVGGLLRSTRSAVGVVVGEWVSPWRPELSLVISFLEKALGYSLEARENPDFPRDLHQRSLANIHWVWRKCAGLRWRTFLFFKGHTLGFESHSFGYHARPEQLHGRTS